MPLKTFWMLHKNIDRIQAEKGLMQLQIAGFAQSSESFRMMAEQLTAQMGRPIEFDEAKRVMEEAVLDREGLSSLKGL